MNQNQKNKHYLWNIRHLNEKLDAFENDILNSKTTYTEFLTLTVKIKIPRIMIFFFNAREGFLRKLNHENKYEMLQLNIDIITRVAISVNNKKEKKLLIKKLNLLNQKKDIWMNTHTIQDLYN